MLKTVIDIFKDLFQYEFFRRLVIVCLLPNILVLGFSANDLDRPQSAIWSLFLNPYWQIEKIIFYAFVTICVLDILYLCIESISSQIEEKQKRELEEKREHERQVQDMIDYNNRMRKLEAQRKFEEQNPTLQEPVKPQPIVNASEVLSPEEIKRRALRDITGRSA